MKKQIKDIKIIPELYPRDKINDNKVEEYTHYIGVLPAIVINQDNILIDGAHRLHAYKQADQKEIECSIMQTKDDDDLFLKAVELNAKHGYQMTQKEKKNHVIKLYEKTIKGEAKTFDVKRIKETFSIPESTFSLWTKDLNEELEGQQLAKILDLHLRNKTQEEIGKEMGISQQAVASKIKQIEQKFDEIQQNPELEIEVKYQFLSEKIDILQDFKPLIYNIWNLHSEDSDNTHFGKFPFTFMENIIYYYTKPFDVVFDCFGGGGTTIDVCKKWLRKYYCSDLNPIETRNDIFKHDITKGLPKDIPSKIDFVFLDPPYWKQAEEKYSKDKTDLGNVTLEKFYWDITNLAKELKSKMKSGYVAFVIQPTQWNNDKKFEDHIIKIINIFEKYGFKEEMRYVLPYSSQQCTPQMVNIAKEEKFPLNLIRDLVVFKK
ncbi:hypothetical protein LCGC14_1433840 [marine sediment metagenome]|uniref:DNA methylase N-4/N-6 domain-containing protein n=1 Tax=marine sediment metagenome TaxID=412755 RepID=A0A0F9JN81_9ZZZZ